MSSRTNVPKMLRKLDGACSKGKVDRPRGYPWLTTRLSFPTVCSMHYDERGLCTLEVQPVRVKNRAKELTIL